VGTSAQLSRKTSSLQNCRHNVQGAVSSCSVLVAAGICLMRLAWQSAVLCQCHLHGRVHGQQTKPQQHGPQHPCWRKTWLLSPYNQQGQKQPCKPAFNELWACRTEQFWQGAASALDVCSYCPAAWLQLLTDQGTIKSSKAVE